MPLFVVLSAETGVDGQELRVACILAVITADINRLRLRQARYQPDMYGQTLQRAAEIGVDTGLILIRDQMRIVENRIMLFVAGFLMSILDGDLLELLDNVHSLIFNSLIHNAGTAL